MNFKFHISHFRTSCSTILVIFVKGKLTKKSQQSLTLFVYLLFFIFIISYLNLLILKYFNSFYF